MGFFYLLKGEGTGERGKGTRDRGNRGGGSTTYQTQTRQSPEKILNNIISNYTIQAGRGVIYMDV